MHRVHLCCLEMHTNAVSPVQYTATANKCLHWSIWNLEIDAIKCDRKRMFHREYNWLKHSIQMFWHTHRHRQIDIIYVLVCVYLDVLRHLLLFDKFHRTIGCAENAGGEPKRRFNIDLNWYDLNMFLVSWNRDKTERCEYSQIPIKIVCSVCEQWLLCAVCMWFIWDFGVCSCAVRIFRCCCCGTHDKREAY